MLLSAAIFFQIEIQKEKNSISNLKLKHVESLAFLSNFPGDVKQFTFDLLKIFTCMIESQGRLLLTVFHHHLL